MHRPWTGTYRPWTGTYELSSLKFLQVWSLHALPDGSGFVSASADKYVKVWEWTRVDAEGEAPRIGVELQKSINTGQVVLCARVSPDGNLVAVSLISNVIKVLNSWT
jgi:U3 small nucleolar RNA-associated protein 12